jgi:replication factor C subunit 2/4
MLVQNLNYVKTMNNKITEDDVYEIANFIDKNMLEKISLVCLNVKDKPNINKIVNLTKHIRSQGYPIYNIMKQINDIVINTSQLTDKMKAVISLHFAKTERRLIEGADEYLQLLSILMCINSVFLNIKTVHDEYN